MNQTPLVWWNVVLTLLVVVIPLALRRRYDRELEKVKTELAQETFRYSHVFKRTEEVIATIYKMLIEVDAEMTVGSVREIQSFGDEQPVCESEEKAKAFMKFFRSNRIYIPTDTAQKIEAFNKNLNESIKAFRTLITTPVLEKEDEPWNSSPAFKRAVENSQKVETEKTTLLKSLEIDFRRILGFPSDF